MRDRVAASCIACAPLLFVLMACEASPTAGAPCARASDCSAPLVCTLGRCRAQCVTSRDCPIEARCLIEPSSGVGACSLATVDDCGGGSACPSGFVCRDAVCVNACGSIVACPDGVCAQGACLPMRDPDAGVDAANGADASASCASDAECDDHVFCNGSERCAPGAAGADARGCVAASSSACPPPMTCSEVARSCMGACPDADGDGHTALACGGDDCVDTNPAFFPGAHGTCGICPVSASGPAMGAEVCNDLDDDCNGRVDDGATCMIAHGTSFCVSGSCVIASCIPGFHVCGAACASDTAIATCGQSCAPCTPPAHSVATCSGTGCGFTCDAGYAPVGAICDIAPPRAIAPLSTATVTSRRPTLRWVLAPGTDGARVDLCRDRACMNLITMIDVSGSSAVPSIDLPTGVVFWRLHGSIGGVAGTATSATWQMEVGARTAPVDASWGTMLDVNGDGYADVAVGADAAASQAGHVYVYLGGSTGLMTSTPIMLTGPDGAGGKFGYAVASAGDVNGDGFADLGVGAIGALGSTGRAYVYLGGASGLATTPASTITGPDGAGGVFGYFVAGVGDVDGDGYGDFAASAWAVLSHTGRAYVYLGSATGLGTAPSPVHTLTGPDGANGQFGCSLASAGDVDADGYGDLAVGANNVASSAGRAYVYRGGPTGLGTSTSPATMLSGPAANALFGYVVASAGDVNGDGYADLLVTAEGVSSFTGRAYVYLGGMSGLSMSAVATLVGPDGVNGYFGEAASGAGDVDGDGYADVVIGAYNVSTATGRAYVYRGGTSGTSMTPGAPLVGPAGTNAGFGAAVSGAGDVDGDHYADVVIGADLVSSSTGRAYLYSGGMGGLATTPTTPLMSTDGAGAEYGFSVASADESLSRCAAASSHS